MMFVLIKGKDEGFGYHIVQTFGPFMSGDAAMAFAQAQDVAGDDVEWTVVELKKPE